MWLQDFLPNNIKGIRIMTYGYNTELVGASTQAGRLLDHRRDLIQQMQSARSSPQVVIVVRLFYWLVNSQ
jgi:hypothetical protein